MAESEINLLLGSRGAALYECALSFRRRFPKLFPDVVLKELGRFLLGCSPAVIDRCSLSFLTHLLLSYCKLTRSLEKRMQVKILEADDACTYSIALSCHLLQDYEIFQEPHMLKGIESLISGVKQVPGSFFSYKSNEMYFCHLQIKKIRGGTFSHGEKEALKLRLAFECEQRIERTSPALILPGNEEDLFKNIRHLSHELKYVDDLPQVMITFVEYSQKILKFLVIILRVITPSTLPISSLKAKLPSVLHFSLDHLFCVDKLRKKYPKEAVVCTLEIDSSIFLRNNNEVNLRAARQYIVKALESMLGSYRDYNGGLLSQENKQWLAIKRLLEKKKTPCSSLLESFFYEIKPITMRSVISAQTGCNMAALFNKILDIPLPKTQKYHIAVECSKEAHLVFIKTTEKDWKTSLPLRVLAHSSHIASASIEHDGMLYLCFVHQYPESPILEKAVLQELGHHCLRSSDQDSPILRINFQGGDPPSLNPKFATDIQGHTLANCLFEGLTRMNGTGKAEMALAKSIELSADKTLYTFHLRPSYWSNGETLTAFDFERTWKKTILSSPVSMNQDCFHLIKDVARARQNIVPIDDVGIVVKDMHTLCVQLENPCSYFLNLVATPPFFPLYGDSEEPIHFNGPFTLAKWQRDHLLYLSLNPFYWNNAATKLAGIKIFMIKDPKIAYQMFQEGQLDFIGDPISPLPPDILKQPNVQKELVSKSVSRVFWIHCNINAFPLNNTHLRQALSLAIDRKKLVENVFINQTPYFSPLPPKYSHFQGRENKEEAVALFNLALEEMKIERSQFPPLVISYSGLSFEQALIEELKMQWHKTLGLVILFKKLPWNELSPTFERGDFQLGGIFRRDLFNHVVSYLNFFKKSFQARYSWNSEEFNHFLDEEKDLENMEQILIEEVPVIPLITQRYLALISERIKGFEWNEDGCLNLNKVYINENNTKNCPRPFSSYTCSRASTEGSSYVRNNTHP